MATLSHYKGRICNGAGADNDGATMIGWLIEMFEGQVQDPHVFIQTLGRFAESEPAEGGPLANQMSDLIITKRVDLAAVRQVLLDTGRGDLMDVLDRLLELLEPYIQEGGVDE